MTPPSKEALAQLAVQLTNLATSVEDAASTVRRMVVDYDTPAPAPRRLRLAVHDYDGNTPLDVNTYDVYDIQRGPWWDPRMVGNKELYVFGAYVRRPGDREGLTQFLPPAEVPDTWLLHYLNGDPVWRPTNGGDFLIDVGNTDWRTRALDRAVAECSYYSADGFYLDEVDKTSGWAWDGTTAFKEFSGDAAWQDRMVGFVEALSVRLHAEGFKLWINLGADYDVADPWQQRLITAADGINIEFFVARDGVNQQPATYNEGWLRGHRFVSAVEKAGKAVHVHASSNDQGRINYAFYSWLASTEFVGSFSAGLNHDGQRKLPTATLLDAARKLGQPVEDAKQPGPGSYFTRRFEYGSMIINPQRTTINGVGPLSGRVTVV